jgi:hypothetical protein
LIKEQLSMKLSRKVTVALGGTLASLAIAGAAFAYFTTTGGGDGAGTVGTSSTIVITGTAATTLYPGTSSTVSFTVNNSSPGHQFVTTIHLDSVSTDGPHSACVVTDFSMADVAANQDVASGPAIVITQTGTLLMANNPIANQDACKNAPLTLHLSSN